MKICGIICELNPAHKGHEYIFRKAREITGADYVIAIMSGNYVQRGIPAVIDKYKRTRMALSIGADAVFEMPLVFATGSAQYFACSGVSILDKLGCSEVFFGSETGEISSLEAMDYVPGIINNPNDILGREYVKGISSLKLNINPVTIKRNGSGYNSETISSDNYCSALAIRNAILNTDEISGDEISGILIDNMPEISADILKNEIENGHIMEPGYFSDVLFAKLMEKSDSGYAEYFDVFPDLSFKIQSRLRDYTDIAEFTNLLKSKDIAYSHVQRALLHILLEVKNEYAEIGKKYDYAPYTRLLGIKKESTALLKYINEYANENSKLPVLNKISDDVKLLDENRLKIWNCHMKADHLYSYIMRAAAEEHRKKCDKEHDKEKIGSMRKGFVHEFTRSVIIL